MTQEIPLDLYERQIKLEEEMQSMGIARFREEVRQARENQRGEALPGVVRLLDEGLTPVIAGIKEWKDSFKDYDKAKPRKNIKAYSYIKNVKTESLAYLALKGVLSGTQADSCSLVTISSIIGKQVLQEINMLEFKKASASHYKTVKKDITKKFKPHETDRKALIMRVQARKDDVDLTHWTKTQRLLVGAALIGIIMETTGLIQFKENKPVRSGTSVKSPMQSIEITPSTQAWLTAYESRCEVLNPVILPFLCEPKDWVSARDGAFHSDFVKESVVRHASPKYLDELDNSDMWEVLQALNTLQRTKWKINTQVLDVLQDCLKADLRLGKIPNRTPLDLPEYPVDINENKESLKTWKREASAIYTENARSFSKSLSLHKTVLVAEKMRDEEQIYFAYRLCFRGRIYSLQHHLQPQGNDISKSLLLFADGYKLDDESGAWLAVHGANVFGEDKISLEDRVLWVQQNEQKILDSARNPLEYTWWSEADKPWQFLAFCFEWLGFTEDPENFLSHISVAQDGSCNGLQNFSAILRDPVGGKAVNLIPGELPEDIYAIVADNVNELLEKSDNPYAKVWKGFVDRKTVKRPTMTLPYGATLLGFKDQILEEVQGWKDEGKPIPEFSHSGHAEASFLAQVITESLQATVQGASEVMKWLQEVSNIVSTANLPIYWKSPTGMLILQDYRNTTACRIKTQINGEVKRLSLRNKTQSINKRKMAAAVSPNFIHSVDATHLTRTVNLCDTNGITSLHMIHDSFGTHAAKVPLMNEILRIAFIQIHEENPLQMFYESIKGQVKNPEEIPAPPAPKTLNLQEVLESPYFFA